MAYIGEVEKGAVVIGATNLLTGLVPANATVFLGAQETSSGSGVYEAIWKVPPSADVNNSLNYRPITIDTGTVPIDPDDGRDASLHTSDVVVGVSLVGTHPEI